MAITWKTILHATTKVSIGSRRRGLGSTSSQNNGFTQQQILLLQSLAVASACVSLVAGMIAFYWFVRMRRAYRHHLIILLIMSDMFKSLWLLVFPVASFIREAIPSDSAFCQVSGYFLAFATEASDVAIFMIALHSALYIFRSSRSKGEAGLYRHRYIAYAVWLIWPSLAASLAFLGSSTAYVSGNVSCSLPVRPYWFRLALSWVPRYSILLGIAGIYLAIYIYVRHKFKNFNATSDGLGMANYSGVSAAQPAGQLDGMELSNVNITPPGPIVGSHHGSRSGSDAEGCAPHSGPSWENYAFGRHEPLHHPSNPAFAVDPSGSKRPSVASDLSSGRSGSRKNYSVAEALQSHRFDSSAPEFLRGSIVASSLQQASLNDSVGGIPAPYGANPTAELDNQALASESLTRRYRAVRGQLRLLWVYPFVYMIIWTIPFVNHCLNYNDNYAKNPNFGLVTASTIGLALQCAANALMFSIKEKPWNRRHGTVQTTTALGKRPWRGDRQP